MLIALTLISRNAKRKIMLFDTFDGMTMPSDADTDINGYSAAALLDGQHGEQLAELVAARVEMSSVQRALESTG